MGIDNLFMKTTNSKGSTTEPAVAVVKKLFTSCVCVVGRGIEAFWLTTVE